MGSQVAALLALELPLPEVQLRLENFYLRGYFRAILWDLTLPIVAIMTGEAFSNRIKRLVGGPDLHVEGFCQKLFVEHFFFKIQRYVVVVLFCFYKLVNSKRACSFVGSFVAGCSCRVFVAAAFPSCCHSGWCADGRRADQQYAGRSGARTRVRYHHCHRCEHARKPSRHARVHTSVWMVDSVAEADWRTCKEKEMKRFGR